MSTDLPPTHVSFRDWLAGPGRVEELIKVAEADARDRAMDECADGRDHLAAEMYRQGRRDVVLELEALARRYQTSIPRHVLLTRLDSLRDTL